MLPEAQVHVIVERILGISAATVFKRVASRSATDAAGSMAQLVAREKR
jgi:hypothetical protein